MQQSYSDSYKVGTPLGEFRWRYQTRNKAIPTAQKLEHGNILRTRNTVLCNKAILTAQKLELTLNLLERNKAILTAQKLERMIGEAGAEVYPQQQSYSDSSEVGTWRKKGSHVMQQSYSDSSEVGTANLLSAMFFNFGNKAIQTA